MTDELRCPACGCLEVQVEPGRGSACTPMPPVDALRCPRCGNTGTRIGYRSGAVIRWQRDAPAGR